MSFAKSVLGYRAPANDATIRELIRESKNHKEAEEPPDRCGLLMIFETSKQRTWLVASSRRLYCVLDDFRRPEPRYRWSMKTKKLISQEYKVTTRNNTDRTGLVDIGPRHRDWLYSKQLFGRKGIEELILELVNEGID